MQGATKALVLSGLFEVARVEMSFGAGSLELETDTSICWFLKASQTFAL